MAVTTNAVATCSASVHSVVLHSVYCATQMLESLLPARGACDIPHGDNVEQVRLCEFDAAHSDDHGEMSHSDDSGTEEGTGKRRVRCAHQ